MYCTLGRAVLSIIDVVVQYSVFKQTAVLNQPLKDTYEIQNNDLTLIFLLKSSEILKVCR